MDVGRRIGYLILALLTAFPLDVLPKIGVTKEEKGYLGFGLAFHSIKGGIQNG